MTATPHPGTEHEHGSVNDAFARVARVTARLLGHPGIFVLAVTIVVLWAITGPIFHWSDTWQLVINTGTTIITFLMVFVIQNTQNRDGAAVQLKLDELIRATKRARNQLIDLEEFSEEELKHLKNEFARLAARRQAFQEHEKTRGKHG